MEMFGSTLLLILVLVFGFSQAVPNSLQISDHICYELESYPTTINLSLLPKEYKNLTILWVSNYTQSETTYDLTSTLEIKPPTNEKCKVLALIDNENGYLAEVQFNLIFTNGKNAVSDEIDNKLNVITCNAAVVQNKNKNAIHNKLLATCSLNVLNNENENYKNATHNMLLTNSSLKVLNNKNKTYSYAMMFIIVGVFVPIIAVIVVIIICCFKCYKHNNGTNQNGTTNNEFEIDSIDHGTNQNGITGVQVETDSIDHVINENGITPVEDQIEAKNNGTNKNGRTGVRVKSDSNDRVINQNGIIPVEDNIKAKNNGINKNGRTGAKVQGENKLEDDKTDQYETTRV